MTALVAPGPHPLERGEGPLALTLAMDERDPGSLGAASRLRSRVSPELAALALDQAALRLRARTKFGDDAAGLWFTATGLEQATRPEVSQWRAETFGRGMTRVVDLGCGLGFDALAMGRAGLAVEAVERDELTAACAARNLADVGGRVLVGDAERFDLTGEDATLVFVDPARRSSTGRSWRLEDLSPSWEFVMGLRERCTRLVVKLGPGIARNLLPDDATRHWVSHEGTLVELCLSTALGLSTDGLSSDRGLSSDGGLSTGESEGALDRAVVIRGGVRHELVGRHEGRLPVAGVGEFVHEPDPAVIRGQLYSEVVDGHNAWMVDHDVAYLSSDAPIDSPMLTSFRVLEVLPWSEKVLRGWCREHGIGTIEIKKRGLDLDPAELRRRLKLKGSASATVIITPTPAGARALVCER